MKVVEVELINSFKQILRLEDFKPAFINSVTTRN
jgi:hypothetical protein